MLGLIKEKLKSVRAEVASSVKTALKINEPEPPRPLGPAAVPTATEPRRDSLPIDSASELLCRYQDHWKAIHVQTDENSETASKLGLQTQAVRTVLSNRATQLNKFNEELRHVSALLKSVVTVTEKISALHELCAAVEDALIVLEDACEEQELARLMDDHVQKLSTYRQRRRSDAEKMAVHLAEEYTRRKRRQEAAAAQPEGDKNDTAEKQKQYQLAFEEDLKRFRETGEGGVPRQSSRSKSMDSSGGQAEAEVVLAQVELDTGGVSTELDAFLNGDSGQQQSTGERKASPEVVEDADNEVTEQGPVTDVFNDDARAARQRAFTSSCESGTSVASLEWDSSGDKLARSKPEDLFEDDAYSVDDDMAESMTEMDTCTERALVARSNQEIAVVGPLVAGEDDASLK